MNEPISKTIEAPSLVESVREHLIGDIMEQRYLPGQKLPILEIAARYGVSETPVKQAFNRLISEGMLEALPRRGVVVREVPKEEVRELMEARQILNLACVEAAISCSPKEREVMREQLEEQLGAHRELLNGVEDRLNIDIYMHYVSIDRAYHTIYLRCIKNRTIERIYDQLRVQAYAYVSLSGIMAKRLRQALEDHTAIFDAWCSGDRNRMINEINRHKEGAIRTLNVIYENERS